MFYRQCLALAAMAMLPFAVHAQQTPTHPDAANPSAPASSSRYESAFATYQVAAGEEPSPDQVWRQANDEMGQLGGHAGHIKPVTDTKAQPPAESAAPAKPDAKPAVRPAAQPVDHSKHH